MKTYEEIARQAQSEADRTGADQGVEKLGSEYRTFGLPQAKNRYGHELRCEVRHCTDLSRTLPGHGYTATQSVKGSGTW
jgi:hypothetical protein